MSSAIAEMWRKLWAHLGLGAETTAPADPAALAVLPPSLEAVRAFQVEIAPDDPLRAYLLAAAGAVEIAALELDSPALRSMQDAGIQVSVPLISQGELIGLLNLGGRRSEQQYTSDDRRLLNRLATRAAPALRVAQMVRQEQLVARQRERVEQELRVARLIQQTLLPDETPTLDGWRVGVIWQPAREVSGDFYDFLSLPDGRMGIIAADVTDKGVPAALVMASARSLLRAVAERYVTPGDVLQRANDMLCPDMPPKMFVTCLYLVFDPVSGALEFANAGHNLPMKFGPEGIQELRATGMPLGLIPGMRYEQTAAHLAPGEMLLLYSDGLVEAHNPQGEMYGFPQLRRRLAELAGRSDLIAALMQSLADFTGLDWEQEDDVTLVTLEHLPLSEAVSDPLPAEPASAETTAGEPPAAAPDESTGQVLAEFELPSQPGNELVAMQRAAEIAAPLGLSPAALERLKTAVAETAMNAMEHGNHYRADLPVAFRLLAYPEHLTIYITDHGAGQPMPDYVQPDLDAKLAGLQSPRGWGLFLIKNMVDDMSVQIDGERHTVALCFDLPRPYTPKENL